MAETGKGSRYIAFLLYFNICFFWGTSNLVTKIGAQDINLTVFSGIRYLITAFIALVISLFMKAKWPDRKREWKVLIIISVLMNFLTNACVYVGNKYADSGLVTVIFSSIPVFITFIDCIILKRHTLGNMGWLGMGGGILGIILIAVFGNPDFHIDVKGVCFTLLAAVFWSVGSVYSKEQTVSSPPIAQVSIEAFITAGIYFTLGMTTGDLDFTGFTALSLVPIGYLAIFDSLIAFMSYICLLKIWKPSVVATYAYINPVVALILGLLVLREPLTLGKIAGMIIIIASVILIDKDRKAENS